MPAAEDAERSAGPLFSLPPPPSPFRSRRDHAYDLEEEVPEEVVPLLVHKGDPLRYRVSCNFRDVGHLGDADEGLWLPLLFRTTSLLTLIRPFVLGIDAMRYRSL